MALPIIGGIDVLWLWNKTLKKAFDEEVLCVSPSAPPLESVVRAAHHLEGEIKDSEFQYGGDKQVFSNVRSQRYMSNLIATKK